MAVLEHDTAAVQGARRSEIRRYWRVFRWLLLSLTCALLLTAGGYFGPGDPLNTVYMWIGIAGVVWCLVQGVYTALSMWSYRWGLELYFEAIWNRRCADRADQITMSSFRKWRRAQGWRFWWAVLRKKHRV